MGIPKDPQTENLGRTPDRNKPESMNDLQSRNEVKIDQASNFITITTDWTSIQPDRTINPCGQRSDSTGHYLDRRGVAIQIRGQKRLTSRGR